MRSVGSPSVDLERKPTTATRRSYCCTHECYARTHIRIYYNMLCNCGNIRAGLYANTHYIDDDAHYSYLRGVYTWRRRVWLTAI